MQVLITGRHMAVGADARAYCNEKAAKLTRFYDRIRSIEVILDGSAGKHTAEMIVHADRTDPFIAVERHEDLLAAVDRVVEKVEAQLRRHKEKHRDRKHAIRSIKELPPG